MIGLWLGDGELTLREDLPRPTLAGEALVRVTTAGICNTDLELVRGYYPFRGILGHEFVGIVEGVPAGHERLHGARVVGEINAVCGACAACAAGRSHHCETRTVLGIVGRDGAFAEYLSLPVENLHAVPDALPDEAAVFTEPLAAALQIREQVHIDADDRVLVIGDGKLGQLVARSLAVPSRGRDGAPHAAPGTLCVAGRHPEKLALLESRGIDTVVVDANGDAAIPGGAFDVAIECAGHPDAFAVARDALRPRGTLVMKSTYAGRLSVDASALVVDEITLVGSRCGPFAPALEMLASGAVTVDDLVVARYPLSAAVRAFERARRRGTLKVLLNMT